MTDTAQRRAERCSARVYDKWRVDVSGHHCTKPAKVKVEGLWFCSVHDPAAVKRREVASHERYQKKYLNPLRYTEAELQAAKKQARREALGEAAKAMCMYCNDAPRWAPMSNSGYHQCSEPGPNMTRCRAIPIHQQLDRLREGQ